MKSFLELSLRDKIKQLYEEGTFIIDIRYYKHKINLYLYENNYFEVFINDKNSRIEKIELLPAESKRITFYADQLKVGINRVKEKRGYHNSVSY